MRIQVSVVMVCAMMSGAAFAQSGSAPESAGAVPATTASATGAGKTFEVASVRKSPQPDMRKMMEGLAQGRRPDWSR